MTVRGSAIALMGLMAMSAVVWLVLPAPRPAEVGVPGASAPVTSGDAVEFCPWRDPKSDLAELFPGSTASRSEIRVLSGRKTELTKRLGRTLDPGEETLQVHRVVSMSGGISGSVLVRRVRGLGGEIELVLGVDNGGAVRGFRLQKHSESPGTVGFLTSEAWAGRFAGRRLDDPWIVREALASVPKESQRSAESIVDGVRSLLILLEASMAKPAPLASVAPTRQ